jgi:hypothetical protein
MYNQQQITQLDPLTQALITLKQGANPTAPNGKPTVAAQTMSAMQPQQSQMPPQGIMGMAPQEGQPQSQGIMGAAQNAATGAAIQQMQEQEKQKALMQMAQQQQQAQQQQFMAAEGGLAMLPARNMGFREGGIIPTANYARGGRIDLSGIEYGKVFDPALAGILGGLPPGIRPPELPPEVESPEQKRMNTLEQQMLALQSKRPDFTAQLMSALDADKQAREKIAAAQAANAPDTLSRLGSLARDYTGGGMRGVSEGVERDRKAATSRMEAEREANRLDALERVKLQQAQYAMEVGDIDKARERTKELAGIRNQQNQLRQTEFKTGADIYGTRIGEQNNTRTNASADARNQATLAAEAEQNRLRMASQERIAGMGQADRGSKENLAMFKAMVDSSGLKTKLKELSARQYNPKLKEDYAKAVKQLDELAKEYGVPANVARILVEMDSPNTTPTAGAPGAAPTKAPKFLGFE